MLSCIFSTYRENDFVLEKCKICRPIIKFEFNVSDLIKIRSWLNFFLWWYINMYRYPVWDRGSRSRDRMVVGFTTTCAISAYHHYSREFEPCSYSIQHYVIKLVSDLRQVGGFLGVPRFPPPIKLTATI
jgi:hypothetical protein